MTGRQPSSGSVNAKQLLEVLQAVKRGDFSARMPSDRTGMAGKIYDTLNEIIELNEQTTKEMEEVAQEVGKEGKTKRRASAATAQGAWKTHVETFNTLIDDLVRPVTEVTSVIGSVANGDLSKAMSLDIDDRPIKGTFLRAAKEINAMVARLDRFAAEVTRVSREVGAEGKLGAQAQVEDVSGTWKDLTDSVNMMAANLTSQVRNIAEVTTAVANGDLSKKITVEAQGEILELRNTINTMVDQLGSFAAEVTRVSREVGTEGQLGGQAKVGGVAGTWKDLTENVNTMANNLTSQVRNIAEVTTAVARGDLSKKITVEAEGEILELRNTINTMVDQLSAFAAEVTRVAREVGTDGKLGGQAKVEGVAGTWKDLTENVNTMANNLTSQVRSIADVTTAVAEGDLTRKVTVEASGEILQLRNTINTMVDQLSAFAAEVTRVARDVGTEGILGGQANVEGVAGTWKDLTENVNTMANNLTGQVRNIAEVTTAVANGDLSKKITVEAKGEILELRNTINTMVDQLSSFADEVTRVAREVGTEGKLGGQAEVEEVGGTWKDLTQNVNTMANNLTGQVRNIAEVTTAVANGDLSKKITVEASGEILELRNTINRMVDQLSTFAAEVTRVSREVGTEGQLGGQAQVEGAAGTWKDLTENVNTMATNLTDQVRNIAEVTTAVAGGDLSKKITVEASGEIMELRNTINTMVDQLGSFAAEVTRVAREVGTEGKLGGQAEVVGVAGTWKELTENVNMMASNLTDQVRNIAEVTTAVAGGDLSKKITVEASGEILELRNTINTMVDQLGSFAAEVTRVAAEVGTDGKLGGQAKVEGVSGTWRELTDNVNTMAANLTSQVRNIAEVTTAVANGDLSRKITVEVSGEILELRNTINTMVDQLSSFAAEVTRVAREVGSEGQLGGQARVQGVSGVWEDLTDNVNSMAANLTNQVRNIATVTTAVANGDLTRKITVDASGEILELKNTINTMVDQLDMFASEVTRVARDVGTEGNLGAQATVKGVAGTWKDLTDGVNTMADNLTGQVRGIATVVTAVANGDLGKKLTVEAKGEIASLSSTINEMTETLGAFADQVTTVAREVGIEGKLGGQANVPGAAGVWRDLTDNVNELAANLTTQVRAIGEVATAVTEGDLTRSITVEASGEVATLRDNVNEMIVNLRDTTRVNEDQDWLKSNLASFTGKLQGQRDLREVCNMILSELVPLVKAQHGAFYNVAKEDNELTLNLLAGYAFKDRKSLANRFKPGEGLIGQCVLEKQRILVTDVPGDYVKISSGLGEAKPMSLVELPVLFEGEVKAVVELAAFGQFSDIALTFLEQLTESIGVMLNTIDATGRTEELLKESQGMALELQNQQEELQQANEELEEKARLLEDQNQEVEKKNIEVERARSDIEEKAQQLSVTSKYKSEFLANMSHELRTPLNSLLILAKIMSENGDRNLTEKQVEHAQTIHASGAELLALINEILDLSKIESGTMAVDVSACRFDDLETWARRSFGQMADEKGLQFSMRRGPSLPPQFETDVKRLQQVLKNLLANAFKFTEAGIVNLDARVATEGWSPDHPVLSRADQVIAFSVSDTGVGIPEDKQKIIFEAFQQVDGTTSRKYGGTGLGLSISREIARLLGGEIRLVSTPGEGSTFTFYLPRTAVKATRDGTGGGGARGRTEYPTSPRAGSPAATVPAQPPAVIVTDVADDRDNIMPGDRTLLIIEDDVRFARLLLDLAREKGFKGLVAIAGQTGLELARRYQPDAITLDMRLPDMFGLTVLDQLKHHSATRHIPVHIISVDDERRRGLAMGAISYLQKPAAKEQLDEVLAKTKTLLERPVGRLLIVEDDEVERNAIRELIGNGDVVSTMVAGGQAALAALREERFDCMVLDLGLPDMTGMELIDRIRADEQIAELPIIVYTGKDLTPEEETELKRVAETVVVKDAASPERLLDETALFLHRIEAKLPDEKRRLLRQLHEKDPVLKGKKVLIVDDDVRNIFALTSLLESQDMQILHAENGKDALRAVRETPDIDVVLMDIMMPQMDGYEATRAIRAMDQFESLPIIALTAKAMKDDRKKCLDAGASDYLAKPVDNDQLLSLLRVWLYHPVAAGTRAPVVSVLGGGETSIPTTDTPVSGD